MSKCIPLYNLVYLLILNFSILMGRGQDSSDVDMPQKWKLNGYVKELTSLSADKSFDDRITDFLIHHRLNMKYDPNEKFSFSAELRNRIFIGQSIKRIPFFSRQLKTSNTNWDWQKSWIDSRDIIVHTSLERLNIAYNQGKWNVRLGRQRVNWGMSSIWNPNDIFNAYNFLDFDYEERHGVDGVKFQYAISDLSDLQLVYAKSNGNQHIVASRYFINTNNYDLQFLGAWYKGRPSLGFGWAGNIGEAGFKGEMQYYFPKENKRRQFNLTAEYDHVFKKGWYWNTGLLYNSWGLGQGIKSFAEADLNISAENLMPARWSLLSGFSKEIGPLWNTNFNVVYSPGMNLMILLGGVKYSLLTNFDLDLIWQSYFAEINSVFQAARHSYFLRFRYSY